MTGCSSRRRRTRSDIKTEIIPGLKPFTDSSRDSDAVKGVALPLTKVPSTTPSAPSGPIGTKIKPKG